MEKHEELKSLQEDRGKIYGEFDIQVKCISDIVGAMVATYQAKNKDTTIPFELLAEWHYLAIKLARIAASPSYKDSYDDLAVYSALIRDKRCKSI